MVTGFSPYLTDPKTLLQGYQIAADGIRDDAVQSAVVKFMQGRVEGHKIGKCPAVDEFARECRSELSRIVANENRIQRSIAPPEQEQSLEHRMMMGALLKTLNRALNGEREAQQYLDEWLAKRGAVNHGWGRARRS